MDAHRCKLLGVAGVVGALLAGCGPRLAPAPTEPTAAEGFEEARAPEQPGLDDDEEGPEALQPGDIVALRLSGPQEQESRPTPIDRGGFVHLPLIGSVKVGGLPVAEAETSVQKAVSKLDRFSKASLELVEPRGRSASVLGAVERPGQVALTGDTRLLGALSASGGARTATVEDRLLPLGDTDGLRVMRRGKALPVDPKKALAGDPRHNVRIRTGDVIYIPPAAAARVMVLGDVGKPRSVAFRAGMRLTEALAEAGGLTRSADASDVRVVRGGYAAPRVYVASPRALFNGEGPDVLLAPGDVIYVTEHWLATAGQVLERLVPATSTAVMAGALAR